METSNRYAALADTDGAAESKNGENGRGNGERSPLNGRGNGERSPLNGNGHAAYSPPAGDESLREHLLEADGYSSDENEGPEAVKPLKAKKPKRDITTVVYERTADDAKKDGARKIFITRSPDNQISYSVHANEASKTNLISRSNEFVRVVAYVSAAGALVTEVLFAGFTIKYVAEGAGKMLTNFFGAEVPYLSVLLPIGLFLGIDDFIANMAFSPAEEAEQMSRDLPDGFWAGFKEFLSKSWNPTVSLPALALFVMSVSGAWSDLDPINAKLNEWMGAGKWSVVGTILYFAISYYIFFSGKDVINSVDFFRNNEGIKQDNVAQMLRKGKVSTAYQITAEGWSQHILRSFLFGGLLKDFSHDVLGAGPAAQKGFDWVGGVSGGFISLLTRHRRVVTNYAGKKDLRLDLLNDDERKLYYDSMKTWEYLSARASEAPYAMVQAATQGYFLGYKTFGHYLGYSAFAPLDIGASVALGVAGYAGNWRANGQRQTGEGFLASSKKAYTFKPEEQKLNGPQYPAAQQQQAQPVLQEHSVEIVSEEQKTLVAAQTACRKEFERIKQQLVGKLNEKLLPAKANAKAQLGRSLLNTKTSRQVQKTKDTIRIFGQELMDNALSIERTRSKISEIADAINNEQSRTAQKPFYEQLAKYRKKHEKLETKQKKLQEELTCLIEIDHALSNLETLSLNNLISLLAYLYDPKYRRVFIISGIECDILPKPSPATFSGHLKTLRELHAEISPIEDDDFNLDSLIAYLSDYPEKTAPAEEAIQQEAKSCCDKVKKALNGAADWLTDTARLAGIKAAKPEIPLVTQLRKLRFDLVRAYLEFAKANAIADDKKDDVSFWIKAINFFDQYGARMITGADFFPNLLAGAGVGIVVGRSNARYFEPKLKENFPKFMKQVKAACQYFVVDPMVATRNFLTCKAGKAAVLEGEAGKLVEPAAPEAAQGPAPRKVVV